MRNEHIDGVAFAALTESDLKDELNLVLGDRKKIQLLKDQMKKL